MQEFKRFTFRQINELPNDRWLAITEGGEWIRCLPEDAYNRGVPDVSEWMRPSDGKRVIIDRG